MRTSRSEIVTVSSKGWVVIPSLLRKKIGIKPGMKIKVTEADGQIVLTLQAKDPVDALFGKLAKGESLTKSLLSERKRERAREQARLHSR